MDKKELFRIGEVAAMFHMSVSTLRHYEAIGLLKPEITDPETGYRYYSSRQFEPLNLIRYLRAIDMPVPRIAEFLQNRDVERIEDMLLQQKEIVRKRQMELQRIEKKIENRLRQIRDAQDSELDCIQQIRIPSCRLAWMDDSLTIRDFFDMEAPIRRLDRDQEEAVIFLGKVGVGITAQNLRAGRFETYDGVFLILDAEDCYNGSAGSVAELPETWCLRIRFCGSHPEALGRYRMLMKYADAHGLEVTGFSREIALIDYGMTNHTEKFVTEISIPVRKGQERCLNEKRH